MNVQTDKCRELLLLTRVSGREHEVRVKRVLLIGCEPARMIRLRRTFRSLRELGVSVKVLKPYTTPRGRPRVLKGIIRYLVITLQIALTKADIYHFNNIPDIVGISLLWKKGVMIYDVRSPWFSSIKETIGLDPLWRIAGLIERIMTRGADLVITANRPLAARARRWGAQKVVMVPNYPPSDFRPTRTRENIRTTLGLGDAPTVLYLGKLSKLEGSDLIKRIILKTCRALPTVKFLIVGDGPQKDSLESFIVKKDLVDRVVMVGWIRHDEIADYVSAADICLLPRKWTSFSEYTAPENILKVGEYLALGKPVVASKMGGFATSGFPVIPVEPSRMADAVIEFLLNPIPVEDTMRPTWDISHHLLEKIYTTLGAISS